MTEGFPDNETRCIECGLHFDTKVETAYDKRQEPVCPRCGTKYLEILRRDGKIVTK